MMRFLRHAGCLVSMFGLLSSCGGAVDESDIGSGRSKQSGAPGDPSTGVPPSGGGPSSSSGAPASGAGGCKPTPPIRADFEAGLDPSWPITGGNAFHLDTVAPLAGKQSLRIDLSPAQSHPYLTVKLPSVCAVRLAFTIRADAKLLSSGQTTIARVTAGPTAWFHLLVGSGGMMSLAQELHTAVAAGMGGGGAVGSLKADTPTVVAITVDLGSKQTSAALAPVGTPMPQATARPMRFDEKNPANPGPITAIDLGSVPGFVGSPSGTYWLDDLTIE